MKKIKILRIIARLNIGGPAIHAILLTQGLNKAKYDSVLVCGNVSKYEGDMFYYANEKRIKSYFIPELKREISIFKDLISFIKIFYIIKMERPDIIHTHTAKAGALGRLAGIVYSFLNKDKPIKLIHTFHGHIFDGYFCKFKTKIFILIEQLLAFFTSKIITVSNSIKEELISLKISKENKIEVIPLGLELDKLLNIPVRNDSILNVGVVGRLVPIKNHYLFLESVAKVIAENPKVEMKFKIIGDGELKEELKIYSHRLNIDKWVNFLGWQNDLVNVYSNLDIVALSSTNEGTPVSLIEAMASGRAIVATDVGGVSDLLGDEIGIPDKPRQNFKVLERGIMVKPKDSVSFSAALIILLQNKALRENMGVLGREFAKNKFTKSRLIEDIENLYEYALVESVQV